MYLENPDHMKRKGARRTSEIPAEILEQLNKGEIETANLVECLAIDFQKLLKNSFPKINSNSLSLFNKNPEAGWVERCRMSAQILLNEFGEKVFDKAKDHRSDMIRSFACAILEIIPDKKLEEKLEYINPLADDSHMGVREAAWMFLRNDISENINHSVKILQPFVKSEKENLRRFAVEATRPRGVWCKHIEVLKSNPEVGLPLLQPLKNEKHRYPANSVANWLNDASKTRPEFVVDLTNEWLKTSNTKETNYICKRALRTLNSKKLKSARP